MYVRHLWSGLSVACAAALTSAMIAPVSGQGAPRTPWGDPDLQGTYTNTYENGTPLERPDQFAGRQLEDIKGEELLALRKQIQQRTVDNFEGPIHAPNNWWQDNLDLHRGGQAWLVVDPPDGKIPPVTAEGKRRLAQRAEEAKKLGGRWDSAESNQLDDRCLIMAGPGPPMMDAAYNSNYHIVQAPGVVMILTEMIHDVRIIPLDGRPQPDARVRQWMGVSRGKWEGETLVVETTNFNGKNPFRGSDENLKVIERFTRFADDTIEYKFTIDDPTMWSRPWTAESAMKKTVGPIFEHACHEGNFGLYNTLVGARLEEKRAAEEALKKGSK